MAEILIYDFIGEDMFGAGVTAKSIRDQLEQIPADEPIVVRINSGGGDVFDGFAIHNLLKERDVHVVIDGLAASAASVIAMAGETRTIASNAHLMIHDPWTMALGNASDMRKQADTLDKIRDAIVTTYAERIDMDADSIRAAMAAETWFNAEEAIAFGFATHTGAEQAKAFNAAHKLYKNAPKEITESAPKAPKAAEQVEQVEQAEQIPEAAQFRIAARQRLSQIR